MGAFDCDCIENLMGRFEEERKADRIQSCVDHINTAVDVDPWAKELVAEMGKEILKAQLSKEGTTSDCISRHDAIDALMEILDRPNHAEFLYTDEICKALNELPSAQPKIIYCKDCRKHNISVGYKENCCALFEWRGISYGHEHDYQYCCHAERRTDG